MRKYLTGSRLGLLAAVMAVSSLASTVPAAWAAPAAQAGDPAATKQVDPRIDGVWVVQSAERQMAPYKDVGGAVFTIKGDKFTVERPGRSKWEGHVYADPKTGKIDFLHEGDTLLPPLAGDKWEGIYRFDGPTLEINTVQAHDARPTEFVSGYDLALFKLQKK